MRIIILSAYLMMAVFGYAQTVEETYPKTYWSPNDTFAIRYKGDSRLDYYTVSRKDKISPGTDAKLDEYAVVYYGVDSLVLRYNNKLPYAHIIYVKFESPKGKTTLRFHFNDLACYFPEEY